MATLPKKVQKISKQEGTPLTALIQLGSQGQIIIVCHESVVSALTSGKTVKEALFPDQIHVGQNDKEEKTIDLRGVDLHLNTDNIVIDRLRMLISHLVVNKGKY